MARALTRQGCNRFKSEVGRIGARCRGDKCPFAPCAYVGKKIHARAEARALGTEIDGIGTDDEGELDFTNGLSAGVAGLSASAPAS